MSTPEHARHPLMRSVLLGVLQRVFSLLLLLFVLTTLLFFLLRMTGDQALALAGPDATTEQITAIRAQFGLDRPLGVQYLSYIGELLRLDFGTSIISGQGAMREATSRLWATVALAITAMAVTVALAIPLGAWMGAMPNTGARRSLAGCIFLLQGMPGFVVALLLVQLFAVQLKWLPFMGYGSFSTWILPTLTLASFLLPKLTRVVASNVDAALREDYIRTARANGASFTELYWRHALPNALLGATALLGTQFAFLLSGSVITETIFGWPGIGSLLIRSIQSADFAVVQAVTLLIAIMVFLINTTTDASFQLLDPRLRRGAG
ncbi:MAG: ABC transporter permease [Gammaproteobacteria bacterium]|nr:MAG: ABC transporter permease [Gammaproteobacteria bacterium]